MIEKIQKLKKLLDENEFSIIIDYSNQLESIAPVYDEDINSIRKAISNYDFGNCRIFVETLLKKINSMEKSEIINEDNYFNLSDLIDIGGIGAIENIGIAPQNEKEWSIYNYNEARMYENIGEYDNAVLHYKKSLSNDKTNIDALLNLKDIYTKFGKFEEILSVLNIHIPFIENLIDRLYLKFSKANIERMLNMLSSSIETVNEIIDEYDNIEKSDLYYESLLFRGITKVSLNSTEKGINDLEYVKKSSPEHFYKNADALMIFGSFNKNISIDEKINYLKKSIEVNPNWEFSRYNLAVILKKEKKYFDALSCYVDAYNLNNKETDYIDGICECLYLLDEREQLKSFLKLGIEMGSQYCIRNSDLL